MQKKISGFKFKVSSYCREENLDIGN
jgi:hypothetical protein